MAAKPNIKFMGRSGGVVHVVTTKREDLKHSKCVSLKKGHEDGVWRGKGLSPEAALALTGCSRCKTHEVAEAERVARMTPAQKRAEAKAKAEETRERMRPSKGKKSKPAKDGPSRRGPKGGDINERMKDLVQEHADYAKQQGWKATATNSGINEWTAEAKRGGETLKLIYRDGRKVWARVVLDNGVEVRLRTTENWKKYAAGKMPVNREPKPTTRGKKSARTEDTVVDDAASRKRLPFDIENDDEDTIIESLLGKTITWRNSQSNTLDSAVVPTRSRNVRIAMHPKALRLILSFYESQGFHKDHGEMLGGERSVYLDKILRVK